MSTKATNRNFWLPGAWTLVFLASIAMLGCGGGGGGGSRCKGNKATVRAWGSNASGQLGDGTMIGSSTPVIASGLSGVTDVAAGNLHTVALHCNGTVWAWGSGTLSPAQVLDPSDSSGVLKGVIALAAGSDHTLALIRDGTVRAWGLNNDGQLGDGTTSVGSPTPVQVIDLSDPSGVLTGVIALAGGGSHSLALRGDGTVRAWGLNMDGQLGDGTTIGSTTPIQVTDPSDPSGFITGVAGIAAAIGHSVARRNDGTVRAWGFNSKGQLGDGTTLSSLTPLQILDPRDPSGFLSGVLGIAAGQEHSVALLGDGTVRAWGWNSEGQLGDGTIVDRLSPIQVTDPSDPSGNLSGVSAIAAGWQHTVALLGSGAVHAWGNNQGGRLGDGTTISSATPVQVVDPGDLSGFLTGVTVIDGGSSHTAAIQ